MWMGIPPVEDRKERGLLAEAVPTGVQHPPINAARTGPLMAIFPSDWLLWHNGLNRIRLADRLNQWLLRLVEA